MKRDKDSKTQLQQLGTNEIQMGSTYIKFSTILHLDPYHRDNVVQKVVDAREARMKVERMSNKRKVVEYAEDKNESRNEPLSKIFKPSEITSLGASAEVIKEAEIVPEATNQATTGPEDNPSAGPTAEKVDKVQNVPKLEPKEELETAFKNIPQGFKYNGIVEMPKEEEMKTETDEPKTYEEISDALKPEIKENQEKSESEDEFFVVDEDAFEVVDELNEAKPEVESKGEDAKKAKAGVYQSEAEKKKAWESLRTSVSSQNQEIQKSNQNWEKLLAEWKVEDKLGYSGPIEIQTKLIKSVSNDRCHQIDRKTFVNDEAKILPFRARLKVGSRTSMANGIQDISLDSPLVKSLRSSIQQNTRQIYDNFIFIMFTKYIHDSSTCYGYIYLVNKVDRFLDIATRNNNLEYCYEENCFKRETMFMTLEIPTKSAKVDF